MHVSTETTVEAATRMRFLLFPFSYLHNKAGALAWPKRKARHPSGLTSLPRATKQEVTMGLKCAPEVSMAE